MVAVKQFAKIEGASRKDHKIDYNNIEIPVKEKDHFLDDHKNSSSDKRKSNEKASYKTTNGFIKTEEDGITAKGMQLAHTANRQDSSTGQSSLLAERFDDKNIFGGISQSTVPVNIHSLFSQGSILKTATTSAKSSTGFQYFTPPKAGGHQNSLSPGSSLNGSLEKKCIAEEDYSEAENESTFNLRKRLASNLDKIIINNFENEEFVHLKDKHHENSVDHIVGEQEITVQDGELMREVLNEVKYFKYWNGGKY